MPNPTTDRLLLDAMLGKLATYLRMCGYDTATVTDETDEEDVLTRLEADNRVLVTRDRELTRRASEAVLLTERAVEDQLRELDAAGFVLELPDDPVRCGACNGRLERVNRTAPTPSYTPDPADVTVWRCVECGQHFWKGSHWDDVAATLSNV
jgi:uncharacterized protein with PIN domain